MIMSQVSASSRPPPSAPPFTAATVGTGTSSRSCSMASNLRLIGVDASCPCPMTPFQRPRRNDASHCAAGSRGNLPRSPR